MALTLRDISTLQGESRYDPNGEIVLGGNGTALMKNPSETDAAIFQVNKLGWAGDWIESESVSLAPGTETKVGGDGVGHSVVSLQWEPAADAPTQAAPQAQPPVVTDAENLYAAAAGAAFWVILAVVLAVLGALAYYYTATGSLPLPGVNV